MQKEFNIGKRKIHFFTKKCFVIAEIGVNHLGNFQLCKKLIDLAAKSGADAVKFQTFSAPCRMFEAIAYASTAAAKARCSRTNVVRDSSTSQSDRTAQRGSDGSLCERPWP